VATGLGGGVLGGAALAAFGLGWPGVAIGAANGALGGWRGTYAWRRPTGWLAFVLDSTWASPLTAAALLPWLGSNRLLLATDEGPIYCVGLDDELVTTYLSSHRGLRVVSAVADLVAAVSADRQRVVLWNSWDGKKPLAELSVSATAKHRVGDIEFA